MAKPTKTYARGKPGQLRGSKAAPGPSKASRERAANIGAFQAGKNYTAKGVKRVGYQPPSAPAAKPRERRFEGAFQSADILRQRGGLTGSKRR